MADIELTRSHSLGLTDGRDAVERVAQQLENDIGVDYEWDGDTLVLGFELPRGAFATSLVREVITDANGTTA